MPAVYLYVVAQQRNVSDATSCVVLSSVRPESDYELVTAVAKHLARMPEYQGDYPHIDIREAWGSTTGEVPPPSPHDPIRRCFQHYYGNCNAYYTT